MFEFARAIRNVVATVSVATGVDLFEGPDVFESCEAAQKLTLDSVASLFAPFNAPSPQSRECIINTAKLVYVLNRYLSMAPGPIPIERPEGSYYFPEQAAAFFAATRLLQLKQSEHKRLVHLLLRTLAPDTQHAFVITASCAKDLSGSIPLRVNALRSIACVSDGQNLDRFIATALSSNDRWLNVGGLLSCLAIMDRVNAVGGDSQLMQTIKKLSTDLWALADSDRADSHTQILSFYVLFRLYENDTQQSSRIVTNCHKSAARDELCELNLVRHAGMLISKGCISLLPYLENVARSSQWVMSQIEAIRWLIQITPEARRAERGAVISECISNLFDQCGNYLSATKKSPRIYEYALVKLTYTLSAYGYTLTESLLFALEDRVSSRNRQTSVLAVITLLKADPARQSRFFGRLISDILLSALPSQRIEIIEVVAAAVSDEPEHILSCCNLLLRTLKSETEPTVRVAAIKALGTVVDHGNTLMCNRNVSASDAVALKSVIIGVISDICEYLEDCEHASVLTAALAWLTTTLPLIENPQRYFRYIYNRALLEACAVRAQAIACLGVVSAEVKDMVWIRRIRSLLRLLTNDHDDEVREVAEFYTQVLSNIIGEVDANSKSNNSLSSRLLSASTLEDPLMVMQPERLVTVLCAHIEAGTGSQPIDLNDLPTIATIESIEPEKTVSSVLPEVQVGGGSSGVDTDNGKPVSMEDPVMSRVESVFEHINVTDSNIELLPRSAPSTLLTEAEAEFAVSVRKFCHVGCQYIVFGFNVRNTIDGPISNVSVRMRITSHPTLKLAPVTSVSIATLSPNCSDDLIVVMKLSNSDSEVMNGFKIAHIILSPELTFQDEDGNDDSIMIDPFRIGLGDYLSVDNSPPAYTEMQVVGEPLKLIVARNSAKCVDTAVADFLSGIRHTPLTVATMGEHVYQGFNILMGQSVGFVLEVKSTPRGILGRCIVRGTSEDAVRDFSDIISSLNQS